MKEALGVAGLRSTAEALDGSLVDRGLVAVGWATVDLERSIEDARADAASAWAPAVRDGILGARSARRPDPATIDGVELVLLEPDTEGLLAATLARFGEGLAVAWFEPDPPGARRSRSAIGGTPFGPGRLVTGGPRWGPFAIVLEGLA